MRQVDGGQRVTLRASLLLGVAGASAALGSAALADTAPSAPPADPDKYAPYSDLGGQVGSGGMTEGKANIFAPVWQNLDSLIFINLGAGTRDGEDMLYDLGLGYRTKLNSDWVLGGYAGFDGTKTNNNNTFNQAVLDAELMSAEWDVRLNGYVANPDRKTVADKYELSINNTQIAILQGEEVGYTGVDGEVGYRVFSTDSTDFRIFVGGFYFSHSDADTESTGQNFNIAYRDIAGPKARAEVTVYDLDLLGPQSRLTVEGEISHDDVRGTTGYFGAALRIPLEEIATGSGAQALDELDRRMVDPVRASDNVLTRWQYTKPEPVIIYGAHMTSQPTNTLYYADNTKGIGTFANPTTLQDATSRNSTNAFIVLTDKNGPVNSTGVVVQSGQTVTEPGTFNVRGVDSGRVFTHDFAPGSGPVSLTSTGPDVITLDSTTNLYGVTITGPFTTGIYGHNVSNVNITDVTISGGGTGTNGIVINQSAAGSSTINISGATITGVTGDGVEVTGTNSTGMTQSITLSLSNSTISAGTEGVDVSATVSGGSTTNEYVGIHNSTVSGGVGDVLVTGSTSAGSTLNQTLVIDPTHLSGGEYGLVLGGVADGGTLNQTIDINQVYVSGTKVSGIDIYAVGINGATLNQTVTMNHVSVTGSLYPIEITASAATSASVTQNVTMTNVTATGGTYNNINIEAFAGYGGTARQYVTMSNVTATNSVDGDGVYIRAAAFDDAAVVQSVAINGLTATGNYFSGVEISGSANSYYKGNTTVAQYVTIANSTISGNGLDGVSAFVSGANYGAARQDLTISHSTLSNNYYDGVGADAVGLFGGSAEQNINLLYDTADNNANDGVLISANALAAGSATQNLYILGGEFNDNGGDGIAISAYSSFGGQVLQNAGIYDVTAEGNGRDGLFVSNNATGYAIGYSVYYSHVSQNVIAAYDNFSNNGRNGVEIQNYAGYGAEINQFVYLFGDTINQNAHDGVHESSKAEAYGYYGGAIRTQLYADLYVVASTADGNGRDGINISGSADGPTYLIQHINVLGTDASYNGRAGFVAYANASNFYSLNIQYITLSGSTFDHNKLDGAAFLASQSYGPLSFGAAIQDVTIQGSDFSYNGHDGLYAFAEAFDFQGRAEQHFTIESSRFDYNGADGASFTAYAHDGVYLPGYNCGQVQGLYGGCAFVRQTVDIIGSDFSHNGGDGIYVYAHANNYGAVYTSSGRPAYTPTMLVEYSTADNNGGDGLHIHNTANNGSYIYSYAALVASHFDNNGANGIEVDSSAGYGSVVGQKTVLIGEPGYATTADGNAGDGLHVYSTASSGSVLQLVGIYNSDLSHNGGSGVSVAGTALNRISSLYASTVAQYVNIMNSTLNYNAGYGARFTSDAFGAYTAAAQHISIKYSTLNGNEIGVGAFANSNYGGSAIQYLYFAADTIANNTGDGVVVEGFAGNQSFTKQVVDFGYLTGLTTYITGNGGDGIYVGTLAIAGASTYQGVFVYDVNASHNKGNGLSIASYANGYGFGSAYIYYSHVSQNVIAAYDTFDFNQKNGVSLTNAVVYGGATNQLVELVGVDASHNTGAGFYANTADLSVRGYDFAFNTNITSDIYLINSTFDHNGANGIDLRSFANSARYIPAFFGGYSYMIQHVEISGSDASNNVGSGLSLNANQSGVYILNAQYLTITNSTFDGNTGAGARLVSVSNYGPGGFGDTFEQITISGSDFSHNGGDGLYLGSLASGRQGRAEQHATISDSTFDYNGNNGVEVYASATNGVYLAGHPCTTVQGLPGGCAFVRQNVSISYSDISHNTGNGVYVHTYANNYGAIYGVSGRPHAPTLELYGVTANYNGGRGLAVSNHVTNHSYLYQYVAAIDSTFNHNGSDGIYAASYVGGSSTMLQRVLLYSYHSQSSASYNAGNGFKSTLEALGGSYARNVNIVEGAATSHNGSFGIDAAVAYADGSSTGLQINAVYFNGIDHNGDGIGLYSIGAGAQQISYIGGNDVGYNAFVGVYGEANFGAFQYVGVYTFGNNVHDNGTNYLFNSFGGSTQILN